MKKLSAFIFLIVCYTHTTLAQGLALNNTGSTADASAMLDISSTSKGVLVPRMTRVQMKAISNPATGLLVYQTDSTTGFYYNTGTPSTPSWLSLASLWTASSGTTYLSSTSDNVSIGSSSAATEKLHVEGNVQIPAAKNYTYASAKTCSVTIPASAFLPEPGYSVASSFGSVYIPGGSITSNGFLEAPINVPDGATITSITAYMLDDDPTYDPGPMQIWQNDVSVGGSSFLGVLPPLASSFSSSAQTTTGSLSLVIDNQNYTYFLRFITQQNDPNILLYKVVIAYTITKVN